MAAPNSTDAEDRVVGVLTKVAELVRGGTSPSSALAEASRAAGLPPALVKLAINAYNTGRTNLQRKTGGDLFDKAADFELADPAKVVEGIYPSAVKSAAAAARDATVSHEYLAPPAFGSARRKTAAAVVELDDAPAPAYPRDPDRFHRKVRGAFEKLAAERAEFGRRLDELQDKVAAGVGELVRYFRTPGHLPVEDVRANAAAAFGPGAAVLVDKVAGSCGKGDKPVKVRRVTTRMARDKAPYSDVEGVLKEAAAYAAVFAEAAAFEKAAVAREFALGRAVAGGAAPLPPDPLLSVARRLAGEKRAFVGGPVSHGIQMGLGSQVGSSVMSRLTPDADGKVKQDAYMSLLDPAHESRLRAIRTQATLSELMQSPYFEGEDPRKVAELFNRLSTLAPRAAEQPMVLEAAMRQLMAQGQADPHGLDQLLGIENQLKDRDQLPSGSPGMLQALAPAFGSGGSSKDEE